MNKYLIGALIGLTFLVGITAASGDQSPFLGLLPHDYKTFISSNIYVVRQCDKLLVFYYAKQVFGLNRYIVIHKDTEEWGLAEKVFGCLQDGEMLYIVGYNNKFDITKYCHSGAQLSFQAAVDLCDLQINAAKSLAENYKWPALFHTLYVYDKTGNPVFDQSNGEYLYFNWNPKSVIVSKRQDSPNGCINFPLQNFFSFSDSADVAAAIQTIIGCFPRANARVDRPLNLIIEHHSPSQSTTLTVPLFSPDYFDAFTKLSLIPHYVTNDCGEQFQIKICQSTGTISIQVYDAETHEYKPFVSNIQLDCDCAKSLASVFDICLTSDAAYIIKRVGSNWKVDTADKPSQFVAYNEATTVEKLLNCLNKKQIIELVGLVPYYLCN